VTTCPSCGHQWTPIPNLGIEGRQFVRDLANELLKTRQEEVPARRLSEIIRALCRLGHVPLYPYDYMPAIRFLKAVRAIEHPDGPANEVRMRWRLNTPKLIEIGKS
jgi:hypothetical protein